MHNLFGPQREWKKNLHNRFSCATGTNIYVKVLCLVIVNVTKYNPQKCQKMTDLWLAVAGVFFQALNTPKLIFSRGSIPDPTGGATTLPQTS